MPKPRKPKTRPFIVRLAQDLSEYADVQVDATSSSEAEDIVSELLGQGKLNTLDYARGDDREGPYTCDSWENEDDETVDCIIKNNQITFPPKTNTNTTRNIPGPLTAYPQCGGELNASTTALGTSIHVPAHPQGSEPEVESEEPQSYRIEIDRCPLYLSIEARSGSAAIANAITLVKQLTQNETTGIHLPLTEPGDHDADAFIYPSLDAKDYRVADIEPLH